MFRPEHLDFVAAPHCVPPLEWRPEDYKVWNEEGPYLLSADIPPTSAAENLPATGAAAIQLAYTRDDLLTLAVVVAGHLNSRGVEVELAPAAGRPERGLILSAGLRPPVDASVFTLGHVPAML